METPEGELLWGTIGVEVRLRANGEVWEWAEFTTPPVHQVTGKRRILYLLLGSERVPAAKALLPVRAASSVECVACAGSGVVVPEKQVHGVMKSFNPMRLYCDACGGLGFV